jgi:predicted TIM-barrel fold metal-dependent hydrolase
VLFGTDFPFLTASRTASDLRESKMFSDADLQAIERDNVARLMPKYRT